MHNILSYSELIQQAFNEAIKNYIKANTILINRNLAYFPGVDVCISNHVRELPSMIMGLEAYFVNDLPEDCVFVICRKEKTAREQLEEEVRKEILTEVQAELIDEFVKSSKNQDWVTTRKVLSEVCPVKVKKICKRIATKYDIDLEEQ